MKPQAHARIAKHKKALNPNNVISKKKKLLYTLNKYFGFAKNMFYNMNH